MSDNKAELNEEHIPTAEDGVSEETHQAEDAVEHDLEAMLDEAKKEADAQKELALRTLADMENLKRRTRLDVENAHKFALENSSVIYCQCWIPWKWAWMRRQKTMRRRTAFGKAWI